MSQAVATTEKRTPVTVAQGLKPQIKDTLPAHINPDSFARTIQTALQMQPALLDTDPRSLMIACMRAATDGLLIDGREAALVIRNVKVGDNKWEKHAVYQPMVQGLLKLARNSGKISSIIAHVVYKNDKFHYVLGDDERIEHEPAPFDQEQGAPIAAYAIVKMNDGTVIREVMRASAILNIAGQGQNAKQYDPEGGKNFAEWWRKTVLRRIVKYIPRSTDDIGRQDAFTRAVEEIDGDFEFEQQDAPPPPPERKKRGAAAAALKDITPAAKTVEQEETPHDPDTGEIIEGDHQQEEDDI